MRTQVGDRYVVEEMRTHGYNFGGEQSGHLVFLDHATTGDGIVGGAAGARGHARERASRCRSCASVMTRYPQVLVNLKVEREEAARRAARRAAAHRQDRARARRRRARAGALLGHRDQGARDGRGPDEARIKGYADEIAAALAQACGAA